MPITAATGVAEGGALSPLLAWLSPAFPVGAFAYSHGLEQVVEDGDVADAASLEAWLGDLIARGSARNDAVLVSVSHAAAARGDRSGLRAVAAVAAVLSPTAERRLETTQQGASFAACARVAWPCATLDDLAAAWDGDLAYPVAFGVAAAGHGAPRQVAIQGFLFAFAANLASAAVRLSVVGQTQAQAMLARLTPLCARVAAELTDATADDLGAATLAVDLASARHETLYSRLFRS